MQQIADCKLQTDACNLRPVTCGGLRTTDDGHFCKMKLFVEHQTTFIYDQPVRESVGELRLYPRDDAGQLCLSFRLTTEPQTAINMLTDRFGNAVHAYSVLPAHSRLVVNATSLVETSQASLIAAPPLTLLQRHDFLSASPYVPANAELAAFARTHAPPDGSAEQIALALSAAIYEQLEYQPGSTDISTTAAAVLAGGRGVCQDFAHLLIGLCRSLGLPARYVSGYLYDARLRPGAIVASHAWAEVFLEEHGWLGLDPTHNCTVGSDYVRVAIGRDYADATPARGVFQGGAHETLEVRVRVRAAEEQPQAIC
jgi:transglutaminase-like putative cysteine protease